MEGDWLLGVEVGGTKLQLGLGRADGCLLALERSQVDPTRGSQGILDQIVRAFQVLLERTSLDRRQVRGVGVGFGGPVDAVRGRTQRSYQVDGWADFPLADWLAEHLGVPAVVIQNDADTAGLAEARFGAGRGYSPLLYLTIGSGIGGALILDGRIYRGGGLGALEIGHLEVPLVSRAGTQTLELEAMASGWGIARRAREAALDRASAGCHDRLVLEWTRGDAQAITAELVASAAQAGEDLALGVLREARGAVAFALRQAIALLAPRRIILGGGVSLIGEAHWFEPIRTLVDADVFRPFRGSFDIVPAALGEEVVVHGALALALDATVAASR